MEPATPCCLEEPHAGDTSRLTDQPIESSGRNGGRVHRGERDPWLYRLLSAAHSRDYRRGFYVFLGFLAVVAGLLNWRGPCLQLAFGHDSIGFLNGAWKVRCGVWPHADYSSALGALNPWMLAAAIWLLGPTADVLPFCYTLFGITVGLLAFVVARPRLPAVLTVLFALTQTLAAIAPHLLRFEWTAATYDGCYNRQGYALVSVLLLLLFLPPRPGQKPREAWDGRVAGAILGVTLFLKISYFMAGAGLCVLAFVCARQRSRKRCWNWLATFALTVAVFLPLIRFDLPAMWRDLHLAANVRMDNPEETFNVSRYLGWLHDAWLEIALLASMQLPLSPPWFLRRSAAQGAAPGWAELAGLAAISTFICMTNTSAGTLSETPLLTSWLFVLLGNVLREPAEGPSRAAAGPLKYKLPTLCSVACILWVFTFGHSLLSLAWSAAPWRTAWQQSALSIANPIDADSMRDLRMVGWAGEERQPLSYAGKINDGLQLLRALGGTHRVEAFDFVNPFPFAMQWPASRGGIWCWHAGYSFSEAHHPGPEEAFGDADVLMYPKYPAHSKSFETMVRVYGAYVDAHFERVAGSRQWSVLRRKSPAEIPD